MVVGWDRFWWCAVGRECEREGAGWKWDEGREWGGMGGMDGWMKEGVNGWMDVCMYA